MTCEFQNCTVPFQKIIKGACFALPNSPQQLFIKTEELWNADGDYFNGVRLTDGSFTVLTDHTPVIPYPMAKVII